MRIKYDVPVQIKQSFYSKMTPLSWHEKNECYIM